MGIANKISWQYLSQINDSLFKFDDKWCMNENKASKAMTYYEEDNLTIMNTSFFCIRRSISSSDSGHLNTGSP